MKMQTEMPDSPISPGEAVWSSPTMRRSDLVQHKEKEKGTVSRTSQIVFGERQHLLRVLDSLEGTDVPIARRQQERRILEELIHALTLELNHINEACDEKIGLVLSEDAKPEMLEKLAKQAPQEDFYLLRLISEHPRANAKTLGKLAKHPYGAIRENVARHPNADANTLAWLRDRKSTRLNSSHTVISYAVFCLKKKKNHAHAS